MQPRPEATSRSTPCLSLAERLAAGGNLTIDEACALKPRSRSGFYQDVRAGLVAIEKLGRKSIITNRAARKYISGEAA